MSLRGVLVSSFNLENLAALMRNDSEQPRVEIQVAPYGQVKPVLLGVDASLWRDKPDFAVVWTQGEAVIDAYRTIRAYEEVPMKRLDDEVREYASLLKKLLDKVRFVFVPTWVRPPDEKIFGMLEMKPSGGTAYALMRMNVLLSECLQDEPRIIFFDSQRWTAVRDAFNPKLWYLGKIPFNNEVFAQASRDFRAALRILNGASKKMIVLDLDDTLWGGTVGEDGWENLRIGGHDPLGEAYADFQSALKSLTRRGVLLGIVSKNEESVALEAIRKHPEMRLKLEDFAGWMINWRDKVQNLADLTARLNLSLDSVVFIDDSPQERLAIRQALPEVEVPEWPEDTMLYKKALLGLSSFNTAALSAEDAHRTQMYVSERARGELKNSARSLEEWLESLDIRITSEELKATNLQRTAQLLNKTNQMNLSTRRMTEAELGEWARHRDRMVVTFRVADKFGDAGLVGLLSLEREPKKSRIVDFVLSCRVIGRGAEKTMLHWASQIAQAWGSEELTAPYKQTPKNKPCFEFWKSTDFIYDSKTGTFCRETKTLYPLPKTVKLIGI